MADFVCLLGEGFGAILCYCIMHKMSRRTKLTVVRVVICADTAVSITSTKPYLAHTRCPVLFYFVLVFLLPLLLIYFKLCF